MKRLRQLADPALTTAVWACGLATLAVVGLILAYLFSEGRYAFDRKYSYGFRFAVQESTPPQGYDFETDISVASIRSNVEGLDERDEKEDAAVADTIWALKDVAPGAVGVSLATQESDITPNEELFRENWRGVRLPTARETFYFFAYGTPQLKGDTMTLEFRPDVGFLPEKFPFNYTLRLVRAPEGVDFTMAAIDLRRQASGKIELPAWRIQGDEDRPKGYLFAVDVVGQGNAVSSTLFGLGQDRWDPTSQYEYYGIWPLLLGTLLMAGIAVLVSAPVGIATGVYLSEIAPSKVRNVLKPVLELLASVPTVVLGFFALSFIGPALLETLANPLGMGSTRSLLTAAITLGILIIPMIATLAEDALANIPHTLRDGGSALGLTSREVLKGIILPAAKAGLIGAVLLGFARAIGETMVVLIVSGGTPTMPKWNLTDLGGSSRGIPDTIANDMANVVPDSPHYGHLFLIGLILFIITLVVNLTGFRLARRAAWKQ